MWMTSAGNEFPVMSGWGSCSHVIWNGDDSNGIRLVSAAQAFTVESHGEKIFRI